MAIQMGFTSHSFSFSVQAFITGLFAALTTTVHGQTLYNDPSKNIFDTYDQVCNGSDPSITLCDGNEDRVFSPPNTFPSAANDYWYAASSNGGGCGACTDPAGRDWAESNLGTINPNRADFGAAGTSSTMTQGWGRAIEPSHCLRAVNGNPLACRDNRGAAISMKNMYVRLYFKLAGVTSTRCPAGLGDPSCFFNFYVGDETFNGQPNRNGVKFIEMRDNLDTGGITYVNVSTTFEPSGSLVFGIGDPGSCVVGPGGNNAGKTCANDSIAGSYCQQHLTTPFNYYDHRDEWIFLEFHISQGGDNGSALEMWMDSCGRDGRSCPAVPTKRIGVSNWDINPTGVCSTPDALYLNTWNPGGTIGEIQFDEIVVRDGDILPQPIGFARTGTGDTIAPSPPTGLSVN